MAKKADVEIIVPMNVDVAPKSYGRDDKKALDFELNAHVEVFCPTPRKVATTAFNS